MKKLALAVILAPALAFGQSYPTPTFSSLTLTNPLAASSGGTGVTNSSTITLGGNLTTTGSNPLVLNTTGSTNITLPTSGTLLNGSSGATAGANSNITSLSGLTTPLSVSQGGTGTTTSTGSGANVLATSPALVTPNLGTPSAATLTHATGLPISTGVSGLGTGVATALGNAVTGSGSMVLSTAPTIANAVVGTQATGTNSTVAASTGFVAAHAPCPSILDFGGNNGGSVDNAAAFAATIAASPAGLACVYFPPGTYLFNSQIGVTLPSTTATLSILGAGVGASTLQWPAGGGIAVTMPGGRGNAIHVRDMSLLTGTTGGTAISLGNTTNSISTQPTENSDITNVSMHGMDGYGLTDYWTYGVNAASWSSINFVGIQVYGAVANGDLAGYCGNGTGIIVQGNTGTSSTPPYGVIYNVIASQFNCLGVGFANGPYSQGATISQSNFTAVKNGITAIAGPGNTQLAVIGSQFNASDNAIVDTIGMPDLEITGNTFLVPENTQSGSSGGLSLQQVFSAEIVGNAFYRIGTAATGTTGIYVGSSPYSGLGALITGNTFIGFANAITLAANSSFCNVQSNSYKNNTANVSNTGTSNTVGGGSP